MPGRQSGSEAVDESTEKGASSARASGRGRAIKRMAATNKPIRICFMT
jgi:hypothetical protein